MYKSHGRMCCRREPRQALCEDHVLALQVCRLQESHNARSDTSVFQRPEQDVLGQLSCYGRSKVDGVRSQQECKMCAGLRHKACSHASKVGSHTEVGPVLTCHDDFHACVYVHCGRWQSTTRMFEHALTYTLDHVE